MNYIFLYAIILSGLVLYFYWEAWRHERNLNRLPLRIHVNGTRGKSSVTRLIASGLRAGGHRVFAKTTGTEAKMIFPDGTEQEICRRGSANIRENIMVIKQAVKCEANAVVVECMAINPELQGFCEKRLIQSNIGVITNIRLDHEDVMGSGIDNIAAALSNTIPQQGLLVTTPESKQILERFNEKVGIVTASGGHLDSSFLEGFPYEVIPDNLAVALKVCELAGVNADIAIKGMRTAKPDAGNVTVSNLTVQSKNVKLVNALAANDPESTLLLWQKYWEANAKTLVFINCRKDRKIRTMQLCDFFGKLHDGYFILAGDAAYGKSLLLKYRVAPGHIFCLSAEPKFKEILDIINGCAEDRLMIFAAGNIKGLSREFLTNLNGVL